MLLFSLFAASVYLNCTLYGAVARIPYYGLTVTEYAEKNRDVFLSLYIAGGAHLPHNERITSISMALVRKVHAETFAAAGQTGQNTLPANGKTVDLAVILVRMLYWTPPVSLALFFLMFFLPKTGRDEG